jgi:hypothetical protein
VGGEQRFLDDRQGKEDFGLGAHGEAVVCVLVLKQL